jgi:hypothetical protein
MKFYPSIFLLIMITTIFSCKNPKSNDLISGESKNTISNTLDNKKMDNKYIEYLQEYEDPDAIGTHEINFQKIGRNVFWVTHYHGAGNRQEYFWKNTNNLLVPCFIFEYGGIDWDAGLEYYFTDVKTGKEKKGKATEVEIIKLKEKFIKENYKNN